VSHVSDPAREPAAADVGWAALAAHLHTRRFGRSYEPLAVCGSTNDLAAARAREGAAEGHVVLADLQTGGRGQKGRRWLSAAAQNLTFSLLLRPTAPLPSLPPITLLAGVAVARVLEAHGLAPRLKWPNDILCDTLAGPRKLVGILTEMATVGDRIRHVVLGIGINVNQTDFAPEVQNTASSLALLQGSPLPRAALLGQLLDGLETLYDQALAEGAGAILSAWRSFAHLPRPCRVERPQGPVVGTAMDVDADGALLVRDERGQLLRIVSGELSPE
jgi:BirA family biotin operon repressor/biotin-[acetyl-CoA-carboxylase] ligase